MSPDGEEVVYISLQYVIYSVWEELQIGQTAHTDLCRLFKAPTMHRELKLLPGAIQIFGKVC